MAKPLSDIDAQSWALLLFLSVLWGGSYLFIGIAVKELPPLVIVLVRVVIAAAVLVPLHLKVLGPLPRGAGVWANFTVMSLLNNIAPFTLFISGLQYIPSGLGSVINATTPLFAVALLIGFRQEPLIPRKIIGLLIGLAGVVVIKGTGFTAFESQSFGILLCLAAAFSYGAAALWARTRLQGIPPLSLATCQLLGSAVLMIPISLAFSSPGALLDASAAAWSSLLALAILSTALAYVVFFRILVRAGASAVTLVTMFLPVVAIFLGHAILGEVLHVREIVGALIIGAALLVIDGRFLGALRRRQNAAG